MNVDLEQVVWDVMFQSVGRSLTVEQVAQKVADYLQDDIRAVLNRLDKAGHLTSVHGGGGYQTVYRMPLIERREERI